MRWTRGWGRALGTEGSKASCALLVLVLAVILGPMIWHADPEKTDLVGRFAGASGTHPLGTDEFGRDLLGRLLYGGRLSLLGAMVVLIVGAGIGLVVGAIAGGRGGLVNALLSRLVDGLLALPTLIVALGIVGALGKSFANLLLALVLTGWPWYARIYRGFVLRERGREYVLAAVAMGADRPRIFVRHIGPNIVGPVLVLATANLGSVILGLASLSFLVLGVQPPQPEWGAMVNGALNHFQTHPWLIIAPGLAISATVILANILGDALRDLLDPHHRSGG